MPRLDRSYFQYTHCYHVILDINHEHTVQMYGWESGAHMCNIAVSISDVATKRYVAIHGYQLDSYAVLASTQI